MGNRRPHKNFVSLIRALALIPDDRRPHLVITGGRGEDPLRPVVDELGLGPWVDLKQWVSTAELADLHASATALAMPSLQEGFCLPVVDAMAQDLPVLLSDLPIFHEVADGAALYFDPVDLSSIAAAMVRITSEPELAERLAQAGRRQAKRFSWAATAQQTLDVFRLALKRPAGGGEGRPSG
jgi:glycosyltransferase involved in cell wall biosynthesis